ncbi:MAG: type II toxin-antitoxin system RelE/ParE family toxin [Phycisphaerae bacterium]|nr:type II toxin-antitoxin system RelE/ParE family toxin [Phycisphaerae bacterium]
MAGFVLTPLADADLDEIWEYVAAESSVPRADKLEADLHEGMIRIGRMPGIGHLRMELADEALRFYRVHKFLIIYRPESRPVQIIRVLHGARDIQAILGAPPIE